MAAGHASETIEMSDNPYETPKGLSEVRHADSSLRRQALTFLRITELILLVPALYNAWEFDARFVRPLSDDLANVFRATNILGLVITAGLVWVLGLAWLEAASRFLRHCLARNTDPIAWQDILYRSLSRVPYLAAAGAVLWTKWIVSFYRWNNHEPAVFWALNTVAHLLAACWYLPLTYQWYRLAKETHGQMMRSLTK